jgi:hypothetical protein
MQFHCSFSFCGFEPGGLKQTQFWVLQQKLEQDEGFDSGGRLRDKAQTSHSECTQASGGLCQQAYDSAPGEEPINSLHSSQKPCQQRNDPEKIDTSLRRRRLLQQLPGTESWF